tara:strand:- start:13564 stop:13881 length:318 start_codon:yes stop_codon:yes gene_type:complete
MKQKEIFKEKLQTNKKVALAIMYVILLFGVTKVCIEASKRRSKKNMVPIDKKTIRAKTPLMNNQNSIGLFDAIKIYSEVQEIKEDDTLAIKKINQKLDKILKNEN